MKTGPTRSETPPPDGTRRDIIRAAATPLDLRSRDYKEARRLRAKALARQAAGMQAARQAVKSLNDVASRLEGKRSAPTSRRERAAQRQAAARRDTPLAHTSEPHPTSFHYPKEAEPRSVHQRPPMQEENADNAPTTSAPEPVPFARATPIERPARLTARQRSFDLVATTRALTPRPAGKRLSRRSLQYAQYPVIAATALGAAYSSTLGQWLILAYALVALLRRWESRYSFGAALFLLITIPLFTLIGQSGIAQTIAVYVYELLVVGTIQAVIELRRSGTSTS